MRSNPLVSVIVPVYNVEQYINQCVESILGQSLDDYEVLLIDDGSTDGSGNICDSWAESDPRVRVFHKRNGGLSDARNYGIDRAAGEFLSFVDSDDYVGPRYLESLCSAMRGHEGCRMSACAHYVVSDRGERVDALAPSDPAVLDREEAFRSVLYHGFVNVSAWAKLYHRTLFDGLRFPVGRLYEDTYVFGSLLNRTERFAFSNYPGYYYVKRSGSIVSGGYRESRLEYLESVDRLVEQARHCSGALERGCLRRRAHARLSVLRYMRDCGPAEREIRNRLRLEILVNKRQLLGDSSLPIRDRTAICLLSLGFAPFYFCWDVYGLLR